MIDGKFRRTLATTAVAAALGIAQSADAAFFSGNFDPVDFSGSFKLFIDDSCLAPDGWKPNAGVCAASLLSASTIVSSSLPEGPNFNGNLTFAPPPVTSNPPLFGSMIVGGTLDSLDTALLPFIPGSSDPTTAQWFLQFVSGAMPGGNYPGGPDEISCDPYCFTPPPCDGYCYAFAPIINSEALVVGGLPRGVYLYAQNDISGGPILVATAQYTTITRVPEPTTLALLLGALGAGLFVRRRTRAHEVS